MPEPPRSPPGTFDVMPGESAAWEQLVASFATVAERAGYGLIVTPTFEDFTVFQRIGSSTDVVRKEMYDFRDKGGRHLALRPEMTASVVRAYIQHRPTVPWKSWCVGSAFRHESPQAGRYREFRQVNLEAIGSRDPDLDAEVVALGSEFFRSVGLTRVELIINSLGDETCRPPYRELLLGYLRSERGALCPEHRARLEENPLRVLDCKKPECRNVVSGAPRQVDHLCEECAAHFARVREGLDSLGVGYTLDPLLVRGLDYYTRTTFEYAGSALEAAHNGVGGGGRYDGLVEAMGGPPTPGIGFAIGIERTLLALQAERGRGAGGGPRLDVFVVDLTGGAAARDLSARLRVAGIRSDRAFDDRSAKAQLKAADRSGARYAAIVGPDELAAGMVTIKDLQGGGAQQSIGAASVVAGVRALLDGASGAGRRGG